PQNKLSLRVCKHGTRSRCLSSVAGVSFPLRLCILVLHTTQRDLGAVERHPGTRTQHGALNRSDCRGLERNARARHEQEGKECDEASRHAPHCAEKRERVANFPKTVQEFRAAPEGFPVQYPLSLLWKSLPSSRWSVSRTGKCRRFPCLIPRSVFVTYTA